MDNLISRQAAIDVMMKLQEEDEKYYGCSIPEGFDGDRAKEALEQLPSAQPELCEEALEDECNGDCDYCPWRRYVPGTDDRIDRVSAAYCGLFDRW